MPSRDELLNEYVRLVDEREKLRATLGDPPDPREWRPQYHRPQFRVGDGLGTKSIDPYERLKAAYDERAQAFQAVEARIAGIRSELAKEPSLPDDPITIKQMCQLCPAGLLVENTVRNWGKGGRPDPLRAASGKQPAIFSYRELRRWFGGKRPDLLNCWPESHQEAMSQLPRKSV